MLHGLGTRVQLRSSTGYLVVTPANSPALLCSCQSDTSMPGCLSCTVSCRGAVHSLGRVPLISEISRFHGQLLRLLTFLSIWVHWDACIQYGSCANAHHNRCLSPCRTVGGAGQVPPHHTPGLVKYSCPAGPAWPLPNGHAWPATMLGWQCLHGLRAHEVGWGAGYVGWRPAAW